MQTSEDFIEGELLPTVNDRIQNPLAVFAALAKAQPEFPPIKKGNTADTGKYTYRYADLADIVEKIKPILKENGLVVSQWPTTDGDGKPVLLTYLATAEGYISHETPLFLAKNDPQGQGSAITYARRYALCAILGVVADADDDGVSAVAAQTAQTAQEEAEANQAREAHAFAMAKALELKEFEGNGPYTAALRDRAAEEGYPTVSAWAFEKPQDVFAAVEEYMEIVREIKAQEAPEQPEPTPTRGRRVRVGSAVTEEADASAE